MNDYKYHYLFTTFDIETFDLEDFKYNFVNMTAFRVVDANDLAVRDVLRDMQKFQPIHNFALHNFTVIQVRNNKEPHMSDDVPLLSLPGHLSCILGVLFQFRCWKTYFIFLHSSRTAV